VVEGPGRSWKVLEGSSLTSAPTTTPQPEPQTRHIPITHPDHASRITNHASTEDALIKSNPVALFSITGICALSVTLWAWNSLAHGAVGRMDYMVDDKSKWSELWLIGWRPANWNPRLVLPALQKLTGDSPQPASLFKLLETFAGEREEPLVLLAAHLRESLRQEALRFHGLHKQETTTPAELAALLSGLDLEPAAEWTIDDAALSTVQTAIRTARELGVLSGQQEKSACVVPRGQVAGVPNSGGGIRGARTATKAAIVRGLGPTAARLHLGDARTRGGARPPGSIDDDGPRSVAN